VNAVVPADGAYASDALVAAVGLNMAEWWEVSGEGYLRHVPKARIVAAVEQAASPAEAPARRR
jgi:ParB family chromosome partitioning protein